MPLISTSIFAKAGELHRKINPKYGCGIIGIGAGAGGMITAWKSRPTTMSVIFTAGQYGICGSPTASRR
jgi:hypothetical protein